MLYYLIFLNYRNTKTFGIQRAFTLTNHKCIQGLRNKGKNQRIFLSKAIFY